MRADNSIHLVTAAQQRHELTRAKAIAAMHELDRAGAAITFESVARHAGVSRSWIYTQPDIKDEIHRLRAQHRGPTAPILPRTALATNRCGGDSKSRTAATANSPTKTSSYAANSPTRSVNSATTDEPDPPPATSRTSQLGNKFRVLTDKAANHAAAP